MFKDYTSAICSDVFNPCNFSHPTDDLYEMIALELFGCHEAMKLLQHCCPLTKQSHFQQLLSLVLSGTAPERHEVGNLKQEKSTPLLIYPVRNSESIIHYRLNHLSSSKPLHVFSDFDITNRK